MDRILILVKIRDFRDKEAADAAEKKKKTIEDYPNVILGKGQFFSRFSMSYNVHI